MKKLFALALAIVMIMTCSLALADRLADIQKNGKIVDYAVVPCESFLKQQLEYGRKYATL